MVKESDRDSRRCGALRLHRSTWVALSLAAVLLLLIIAPGEVLEYRPDERVGIGEGLTMEHGWPWIWLRRTVDWKPLRSGPPPGLPHHGIPWLQKPAWSFEGDVVPGPAPYVERYDVGWWPAALVLDLLASVAILTLLAASLEWRHRRRQLWQFSLAEVLVLMLPASVGLGWWMANRRTHMAEVEAVPLLAKSGYQIDYRGPRLLRRAMGIDLLQPFHHVVEIFISPKNQADLPRIVNQFPWLQEIHFRSDTVVDLDLDAITKLSDLRQLDIPKSQISDAGLAQLQALDEAPELDAFSQSECDQRWHPKTCRVEESQRAATGSKRHR